MSIAITSGASAAIGSACDYQPEPPDQPVQIAAIDLQGTGSRRQVAVIVGQYGFDELALIGVYRLAQPVMRQLCIGDLRGDAGGSDNCGQIQIRRRQLQR